MKYKYVLMILALAFSSVVGLAIPDDTPTTQFAALVSSDGLHAEMSADMPSGYAFSGPIEVVTFVQDEPSGGSVPEYETVEEATDAVRDHIRDYPERGSSWQTYMIWFLTFGFIILAVVAVVQRNILGRKKDKD